MADIAGVSFSIAQPIVNSGVNQLRESENKEAAEELRATSAPQRDQAVNSEPSDVPAEQSVSSRLNFTVPNAENTTEENTIATTTNEQVVVAVEQQIQQANIEANANRSETTDQNSVDAASEQAANQAPPQQNTNVEETVEAINTAATGQEPATNAPQTQPTESSQGSQNVSEASAETVAPAQSQTTTEQPESQNPEVGLGLNSGSIIDVTA